MANRALAPTTLNDTALDILRKLAPATGPDALVVRLGEQGGASRVPEPGADEVVIFKSFLLAGLVPPFSEFFLTVLLYYNVHLCHLVPNSVLMLATFVYLCEQFIGITPNLTLFRSLYTLRVQHTPHAVGSCCFRLRDTGAYIQMPIKDKWEAWSREWMYIQAEVKSDLLTWPEREAVPQDSWSEPVEETPELRVVTARLRELKAAGLTGAMVITDFVSRRISPLRERGRLACYYTGPEDCTRTFVGGKPKTAHRFLFYSLCAPGLAGRG
jgi:hypothetical protein